MAALVLESGDASVKAATSIGQTPLHLACAPSGGLDDADDPTAAMSLLLRSGADVNGRHATAGNQPLHVVCGRRGGGNTAATSCLVADGTDVNAFNRHGATPLSLACPMHSVDLAAALLWTGASVAVGPDGMTPLHAVRG